MRNILRGSLTIFDGLVVATMMATLAAIAGVLALSGASPSKKVIGLCLTIALIGIVAVVVQVAGMIKRQRVRKTLAERLEQGRELYHAIDYEWPRTIAFGLMEWAASVEATLQEWKGDGSYVMLFRPSNLSHVGIMLDVFPEDNPDAIAAFGRSLEGTTDPRWISSGQFEQDLRFNSSHGLRVSLRLFMNHRLGTLEEFVREIRD
jgi:hypothetical protein